MDGRDAAMIDALRRAHEAFNRGDFDAAMEIAHPEVEFVPPGGQASLSGAEALRAWMEPDAFEEQRIEPLDFRVEGRKVLVHAHAQARGAGSGIELDIKNWTVWTFDDDLLVTRMESFLPHEESEALEAAGLSE
jgi:ketosteroid isomerase-like protein